MQFTILGPPVGKGRPRATIRNGKINVYTPGKTRSYEETVALLYLAAGGAKLIGPVRIRIDATFEMPMSWSMKKRKATDGTWCEKKPDHDNISKIISDSLNGVA